MNTLEDIVREKLKVGMIFKNYKDMCNTLGETVRDGKNNKENHFKELNRFFTFEKVKGKNQLIVTEIFNTPKEKIDKRKNNENRLKYQKYFEIILLDMLAREKHQEIVDTKATLMVDLGMISNKYYNEEAKKEILSDIDKPFREYSFTHHDLKILDNRVYNILDRIFFDVLDSLSQKYVITYNKEYHYYVKYNNGKYSDEYVCDKEQENIIREEKYNTLTQLGLEEGNENKYHDVKNPMSYVFLCNKKKRFYEILNKKLSEYDMFNVHEFIRIRYKKEHVINTFNREIIKLNKLELNNRIIDALDTNAESKYNNLINKYETKLNEIYNEYLNDEEIQEWIECGIDYSTECMNKVIKELKEKKSFKPKSDYVKCQKQLSQLLCCIDYDSYIKYLDNKKISNDILSE